MHAAHWVRLDPGRSRAVNPTNEAAPGGRGGNAIRELARRARFSLTLSAEAWKGALKSATYLRAPCISVRAWGKFLQVASFSDPNLMYSSLQEAKSQIKDKGFILEGD